MEANRTRVIAVLVIAIGAVSSAAVLVKAISGVDARVIAFWRMTGAAIILSPFIRNISRKDTLIGALSGLFLAAHFGFWFASLQQIPVMRSTLFVTIAPIWAGLIEWGILKRPPTKYFWLGLALALPGIFLLSSGDVGAGNLIGDLQAIIAGIAGAAYFVIGSELRQRMSFATYAGLVCLVAALALLPFVLYADVPLIGFELNQWLLIGALVAGPQLIGHNGLNYVLKYLPASTVTAATLIEPFVAALLAWLWLSEVPLAREFAGGVLIVFGLYQALRKR